MSFTLMLPVVREEVTLGGFDVTLALRGCLWDRGLPAPGWLSRYHLF
jgi:hypothetical protein